MRKPVISALVTAFLTSCSMPKSIYDGRLMSDFNINTGYAFVKQVNSMPEVTSISIVDEKKDGKHFSVNRVGTCLDTTCTHIPTYKSYITNAREITVAPHRLYNFLRAFFWVGVNEYCRDSNYYRFEVVSGFNTPDRGYIYTEMKNVKVGDTLPATSPYNRDYHYKIVLDTKLDSCWYKFYGTQIFK